MNQCSPCGNKIASDNCQNAPISSLCALDGFESTIVGVDSNSPSPSFLVCGSETIAENKMWIGFVAQTNVLELRVTLSECASQGFTDPIIVAIVETDCENQFNAIDCSNSNNQGGILNESVVLTSDVLIPGNTYYILIEEAVGTVCEIALEVLGGLGAPEFDVQVNSPGQLCPDILNPGEFTAQPGSGAVVDVEVGGGASTNLSFYWCNPNEEVIAITSGQVISPNFVRGELDGSFFNEIGSYSVKVFDNGSCCPACSEVSLEISSPPPASAAIIVGSNGLEGINCNNNSVLVSGSPEDTSIPAVEQWQLIDANGDRQILEVHLVAQDGRLDEISITRDIVENFFPGQESGEFELVYGFLADFTQLCFSDAAVTISYDFRAPQ